MSKIRNIALHLLRIPVDIRLGAGKIASTSHLIVRIQNEQGTVGTGEGTPYFTEIYNVYTISKKIAKALVGKDVGEALGILPEMQERMSSDVRFDYGPFLAYETALMDILSKTNQLPFSELLGRTYRNTIPVCGTIFLWHPRIMAKVAEKWVFEKGVNHLKVKISGMVEKDIDNLQHVREVVGYDVLLRIDANQAYRSVEKAADSLKKLERFEIGIVEQPIKWHDLKGLRHLRKLIAPKVMVDETLRKPSDVEIIAREEAADIINFHPSKLGCLTITKRAIEKTIDLGLEYMIGSAPFTGVGATTLLQLAASIKKLSYPNEEVGLQEEFAIDIVSNPLKVCDGCIDLPIGDGLGAVLEEKNFGEYKIGLSQLKIPLIDFVYFIYDKSSLPVQEQIKRIRRTLTRSVHARFL
jgi:L-alanine-DL-glutamate epimerase-like enolase superfamily enzyme